MYARKAVVRPAMTQPSKPVSANEGPETLVRQIQSYSSPSKSYSIESFQEVAVQPAILRYFN